MLQCQIIEPQLKTTVMPNCTFPCLWSVISERVFTSLIALIILMPVIYILAFGILVHIKIVNWLQIYSSILLNHGNLKWYHWIWANRSFACSVSQTLCDPMECNLSGSSIHIIFKARTLEWVAISYSKYRSFTNLLKVHSILGKWEKIDIAELVYKNILQNFWSFYYCDWM